MKKLALLISIFLCLSSIAQNIESIKARMNTLNSAFDSSYFLSFKVLYNYNSFDSISGQRDSSKRIANYVVKGKSFFYSLGDIEYMQNDSFSITVSNRSKSLFFSNKNLNYPSKSLPINTLNDSFLVKYALSYDIDLLDDSINNNGQISFIKKPDIQGTYQSIYLKYSFRPARLTSLEFKYPEFGEIKQKDSLGNNTNENIRVLMNKTMTMSFYDYSFSDINHEIFKREHYIFYDRLIGKFFPIDKYRGYKIYINGVRESQ